MADFVTLGIILIAQFDGNYFNNWKFWMVILLDEREPLQFVKKDVKSMVDFKSADTQREKRAKEEMLMGLMKRDKMCKRYIIERISDTQSRNCSRQGHGF